MERLVIYIHGKGGNAQEAEHYKFLFPGHDVIGFDYHAQNPWDAKVEFSDYYDKVSKGYDSVIVIANSIGLFFIIITSWQRTRKGIFNFTDCGYEKADTGYDAMGWCNNRRIAEKR